MFGHGQERVGLQDTPVTTITKLAEGNPGALTVMMEMMKESKKIDPQDIMSGAFSPIVLDTHGIYGSRIWMLYKDVCGHDMVKMLGVLRACQLGIESSEKLDHAIDNYGEGIDVDDLLVKVKERLPTFDSDVVEGEVVEVGEGMKSLEFLKKI